MLRTLSDSVEEHISSSSINVCHYIAEWYEDKFVSAAGGSGLTFPGSMYVIKMASTINDVDINILQLRVLLILRHKFGVNLFESESKMND